MGFIIVSISTVREIFTCLVEQKLRSPAVRLPKVIGIDEVYVNRVPRCIIVDIEDKRIIDMLPKRDEYTVLRYLLQTEEKDNLKVVVMDMWRPYFTVVKKVFPHVEVVIDTFHVRRMANQAVSLLLRKFRASLKPGERRQCLHDRFILMKRSYNLSSGEKEMLAEWIEKVPQIGEIYRAKEGFHSIWRISNRKRAENMFDAWRKGIPDRVRFAFKDLLTAFDNWRREIFNYFDFKVTNAFTESSNNLVKLLQKNGRGYSFEVIRIKMLYKDLERFND